MSVSPKAHAEIGCASHWSKQGKAADARFGRIWRACCPKAGARVFNPQQASLVKAIPKIIGGLTGRELLRITNPRSKISRELLGNMPFISGSTA